MIPIITRIIQDHTNALDFEAKAAAEQIIATLTDRDVILIDDDTNAGFAHHMLNALPDAGRQS